MVNQLEIELKFENKDQLLVAFGKTNPPAKKPCMSSCISFWSGKSCWVLVYSALLNLWFSGNDIWPGQIPDGWELQWENDDNEWRIMNGLSWCVATTSLFSAVLNSELYVYARTLVCNNLNLCWICKVNLYPGPAFVWVLCMLCDPVC